MIYEYLATTRGNWIRYDNVLTAVMQGVMIKITMKTGSKQVCVFESEDQARGVQKYLEEVNEK